MKLGDVDLEHKVFVMAEIGNNHNGNFDTAKKMIEEAANAGADGVKFQSFMPELYVHKELPVVGHAQGVHKTQFERLKSIKLTDSQYKELAKLAGNVGLVFMSTPFDEISLDFLNDMVPAIKIASGDVTNIPLLRKVAKKKKQVVLSTGMADENEITRAINIFEKEHVILLHCVARYPTPIDQVNLLSIPYLNEKFNVPVGYSDHTIGIRACQAAVALGATLIEKHFTLDKKQPLGDHILSAEPAELSELVKSVKEIKLSLGKFSKPISKEEMNSRNTMRRGLYAKSDIGKGEIIEADRLVALRPPTEVTVDSFDLIVGKTAISDIPAGSAIKLDMIK